MYVLRRRHILAVRQGTGRRLSLQEHEVPVTQERPAHRLEDERADGLQRVQLRPEEVAVDFQQHRMLARRLALAQRRGHCAARLHHLELQRRARLRHPHTLAVGLASRYTLHSASGYVLVDLE